jgi:hypothetical protein
MVISLIALARSGPSATVLACIGLLAIHDRSPGETTSGIVGFAIGLNFGGVPTPSVPCCSVSSRTSNAGRYFSLMLMPSRAAAISGPLVWGLDLDGLKSSLGTATAYHAAGLNVALMFRDRRGHSTRACLIDRCRAVV